MFMPSTTYFTYYLVTFESHKQFLPGIFPDTRSPDPKVPVRTGRNVSIERKFLETCLKAFLTSRSTNAVMTQDHLSLGHGLFKSGSKFSSTNHDFIVPCLL